MTDETNEHVESTEDVTDNGEVTYTQIASCAVGNYTSPLMRQSLRAKLEAEQEERRQRQKQVFSGGFRKLFG